VNEDRDGGGRKRKRTTPVKISRKKVGGGAKHHTRDKNIMRGRKLSMGSKNYRKINDGIGPQVTKS